MSELANAHGVDEVEAAAQEVIAQHGGDVRMALKAMIAANAQLEDELATALPAISYGYSKGRHARRRA